MKYVANKNLDKRVHKQVTINQIFHKFKSLKYKM